MVPSGSAGGMRRSSSGSGIFFQGDGQSQVSLKSQMSLNTHLVPGRATLDVGPLLADVSNASLNTNSGPSIGASSLVTDANSGLSGGPHTQASASFNTESYMRLPTSPLSFSSNNISISGSSVIEGSSAVQQCSNQDLVLQPKQNQHNMTHLQKKPRLDIKQEDVLQQQALHQLLQRQDSIALQNPNPQLQTLVQQQRLRQQQQQLRQQLLQQGMASGSEIKRPYDGGVCSRRLMQYLFHQRQWPTDNNIAYWRKFVAEYYSPRAKKRWCLSLNDNVGHHFPGVFPQAAMDAWQCDICGSKSGRGFEATFEVLPRLNEIKFGSGVIDELLFLDLPRECRFASGTMMLEYAKAVSESVYEQLRVVREGQLRIIFTPDLKILSWEFCARHHEQLLPRRLVAPQVNQLLQVAEKCQSTISESGPDGVSQPDLQANSVMVLTAGRQLARSLELQSLNDLGFSKRYVRCLQISKVVSSMKDLMGFCTAKEVGPIEGLKNFPRHSSTPKVQMPEMARSGNSLINDNDQLVVRQGGPMTGSPQAALAFSNYPNLLTRQNLTNSAHNNNNNNNNSSPEEATSGNLSPRAVNRFSQNRQLQLTQPGPSPGSPVGPQLLQPPIHIQNRSGGPRNAFGNTPTSRNEGFKGGPTGEDAGFGPRAAQVTHNLDLGDGLVEDVAQEFIDNGFFSSDVDEII